IRESKSLPIPLNRKTGASAFFPMNSVTYLDCRTSTTRRIALVESVMGALWQVDLRQTKDIAPRVPRVGDSRTPEGSNRRWCLPEKTRYNSILWNEKSPS